MADALLSRLAPGELTAFREFCETHWGGRHPLIHDPEMFDYYFCRGQDINFVVAKDGESGAMLGVCGFIPASAGLEPDVWISYILTKKGAPLGLGFQLLGYVAELTDCRTLGCNNIRPKTRGLYDFMGYTVGEAAQYYRYNPDIKKYTLCDITYKIQLPVEKSDGLFVRQLTAETLAEFEFGAFRAQRPFKDLDYVRWRYVDYPWQRYELFELRLGARRALLVTRTIEYEGSRALRVADWIGDRELAAHSGWFLDNYMRELGAEFVDWYVYAEFAAPLLRAAGFAPVGRPNEGGNIIPSYLAPPKMENTLFTVFVSESEGYWMSRADGEGDRPRIEP